MIDYHNNNFPAVIVDASGNVIGNVLRGSTKIVKEVGASGAKVFGVSGRTAGDVIKTVGKGTADVVGVVSGAVEDIIKTSATVTGDVIKDVSETVKKVGTDEEEVEAFDGGACNLCNA